MDVGGTDDGGMDVGGADDGGTVSVPELGFRLGLVLGLFPYVCIIA
ncbi:MULTISPECIES: hypothetical protein [Okeania]|nr:MULTISPECIES: hypothetical protein [Okeania]NES78486.1 hypothetical protein [Okeania sp. SIO1H4]NET15978.1 hypothetical protein [Okeania sp. SIO1H6]NET22017.1 hypothetical protein [Okeania sp. SIO1H5]NET96953.1 hypothetical protein [Okeania sp. SIO1H2]